MRSIAAFACGVAFSGSAVAQTNLLNNGGFESDVRFDFSDLSTWNAFGDSFGGAGLDIGNFAGAPARSGSRAMNHAVVAPGSGIVGALQEVFGITEGTEYRFAIFVRENGVSTGGQLDMKLEWFNSAGQSLRTDTVSILGTQLTSDYTEYAVQAFAPVGAVRVNPLLFTIAFDTTIRVAIDDASLVVVPAPAAGAVLGVAGVLACGRRRGR